jgi:nitrous oxide reductase accessory protein NosL
MRVIDGRSAFFVVGSDVYGPMGKELIPFASRQDADEFKKDHNGVRVLVWDEVTPAIIGRLD